MPWPFTARARFGSYHVVRLVHDGEKSQVFAAEAAGAGETAGRSPGLSAVKLYKPHYDRLAAEIERKHGIPSEAQVGMSLNPPGGTDGAYPIVLTRGEGREFGRRRGCRYIVMEFVEGVTLKSLISVRDARVWQRRAALLGDCCRALRIVHAAGLVCRDFCSQNLIVRPDGPLKMVDLGFVAPAGRAYAERSGTPSYMSPEQVRGEPLTPASDVYSLGMVLHEVLTGRLPYTSSITGADPKSLEERRLEIMAKQVEEPVPELPAQVVQRSARLAALTVRCLQKDPAARPQDADEVLAALRGEA